MFRKLENIRFTYIRSHLSSLFLTSVTVLSTLLTIHILFTPEWINLTIIMVTTTLYIVCGSIMAIYNGFKSSTQMKERLDYEIGRASCRERVYTAVVGVVRREESERIIRVT